MATFIQFIMSDLFLKAQTNNILTDFSYLCVFVRKSDREQTLKNKVPPDTQNPGASGGGSIQILYLSKRINTTQNYSITSKSTVKLKLLSEIIFTHVLKVLKAQVLIGEMKRKSITSSHLRSRN